MSNIALKEIQESQSGKMIALEGDTNVISTQLRLLPPSHKILILPNLLELLTLESENDVFDARAFIRDLQAAVTQRTETARSFLQRSTPTQPRLVFAVHGSVSARTTCITKISQNITNGNIAEAESVFNELVRDGIAGLAQPDKVVEEVDEQVEVDGEDVEDREQQESIDASSENPRETIDSQDQDAAIYSHGGSTYGRMPSPAVSPKPRVLELVRGMEQPKKAGGQYDSKIPISKFASPTSQPNDQIIRTVLTVPNRKTSCVEKRSPFGYKHGVPNLNRRTEGLSQQVEENTDTEDDLYDMNIVSPGQDSILSAPQTPGGVEIGEACLVDVQSSSPTNSVKRTQSVDKLYSSNDRFQDFLLSNAHHLKQTKSHYHLRDKPPILAARNQSDQDLSRFPTLPRTTFVRALETTIRKSSTSTGSSRSLDSSSSPTRLSDRVVFVDRGTDAIEIPAEGSKNVPFLPVFELVEDLVIHFTDDQPNEVFESVVRSYKKGSYPIIPPTPTIQEGCEPLISPRTISSMQLEVDSEVRPASYLTAEGDDFRYNRRSFDPYSDESYPPDIKLQWPPNDHLKIAESSAVILGHTTLPTKEVSSLPTESEEKPLENRFVDFSPVNPGNAISIQNSFRELLSILFPASENYSQYLFPISPEVDRLWKPVFRNEENGSIGIEGRTVDQIIAFGTEEGVKKDFFYQISGQIEKVGMKRDGLNRSGKLDIRYLISIVMQSYVGSSVTQKSPSPISDPHILATLLVPHIEAFLASNASTRLLILHYTSEDLPTIFALRNLLGTDLLKIAGILDTLASDPPSISRPGTSMSSRPRSPTPSNALDSIATRNHQTLQNGSISTLRRPSVTPSLNKISTQVSKPAASFAKADYLLPSTATDSEIATFLSGMWKVLMEKSAFYTPEPEPKPVVIERPPVPPTPSSNTPRDRDSGYPTSSYQTPRASKVSRLTGGATPASTRGHNYAPSISSVTTRGNGGGYAASTTTTITNRHKYAASIASTKTTASDRERKRGDKEWENFYIAEDDSDDDAYDKMILGRGMQRIVPEVRKVGQKANTKKALKWLGLA
ncbi:hypothetical protein BKA65DRAFT_19447 [Rhexocercosporidium sp. MPI-PUGE-AT-0058]|nr:hypothetical protein BKA65DRAFT_19447 [Rhexocercosporidium sp. MPI-PUGE-AT-0058]